jgi:hypothetical protein
MHAQLFHYAYALRNLNGPEDVARMPREQREIAIQSIRIARHCLEVTINSPAYREGMKYGLSKSLAAITLGLIFSQLFIIPMLQPPSRRPFCFVCHISCELTARIFITNG